MTVGNVLNCEGGTTVGLGPLRKKGHTQTLAILRTALLVVREESAFAFIVIDVNGKFRPASATHKLGARIERTSIEAKRDDSTHTMQ